MMAKDNGGLAFPQPTFEHSSTGEVYGAGSWDPLNGGMSLRDWFAGQALAGLVQLRWREDSPSEDVSRAAFRIADAMIEERSK